MWLKLGHSKCVIYLFYHLGRIEVPVVFLSCLVFCFLFLFSMFVLFSEADEMERVELGCSGGGKEYGSITTLLRGEVGSKNISNIFLTKTIVKQDHHHD